MTTEQEVVKQKFYFQVAPGIWGLKDVFVNIYIVQDAESGRATAAAWARTFQQIVLLQLEPLRSRALLSAMLMSCRVRPQRGRPFQLLPVPGLPSSRPVSLYG